MFFCFGEEENHKRDDRDIIEEVENTADSDDESTDDEEEEESSDEEEDLGTLQVVPLVPSDSDEGNPFDFWGLKFDGAHYPGLDSIVITNVDEKRYPDGIIKKCDEVVGVFDEPIHPGTDWKMLYALMKERYELKKGDNKSADPANPVAPVEIFLKRKETGKYMYNSEKNFLYALAREHFIKDDDLGPECRAFELCFDKNLFFRCVRHLEDVKMYLEDDLAQLNAKVKLVAMEGEGAKPALLTDLMRQETQIKFMEELNEMLIVRREKRARIAENMNRATHGTSPKHVKNKNIEEAEVAVIEDKIIKLSQARILTIMKYSEYDFRADLNRLQADITKCEVEIKLFNKKARRKKKDLKMKSVDSDLTFFNQLLEQSDRCKIPFMDYIFSKEMEIMSLFDELRQMENLDMLFPTRNAFWHMEAEDMDKQRDKKRQVDREHMKIIMQGKTPIVYG